MPRSSVLRIRAVFCRCAVAVLCLAAAMFAGAFARADDAALGEAQKRFHEGLPLMDAGKFEEARLKFLQAVAVLKAPPIFYNLASTEERTGHEVEAVQHYRTFLATAASDARVTDAQREKARQNIASLLKKLGQLALQVPPDAKVTIDGVAYGGNLDEPIAVKPGLHTVEAVFDGRLKRATVQSEIGSLTSVAFSSDEAALPPSSTAPAPEPPAVRSSLGYGVPIGLAALGVISLTVGVGFLVDSNAKADEANDFDRATPGGACNGTAPLRCKSYDAKSDAASNSRTLATVALVGGGALLAGAVVAWIFWPQAKPTSTPKVGAPGDAPRMRVIPLVGSSFGLHIDF